MKLKIKIKNNNLFKNNWKIILNKFKFNNYILNNKEMINK
jgi:hypothetical protein